MCIYMQGQENMYSGLRTRTAVLEHVRRSSNMYGDLLRGQKFTGQQIQESSWRSRFWRLVATRGAIY